MLTEFVCRKVSKGEKPNISTRLSGATTVRQQGNARMQQRQLSQRHKVLAVQLSESVPEPQHEN